VLHISDHYMAFNTNICQIIVFAFRKIPETTGKREVAGILPLSRPMSRQLSRESERSNTSTATRQFYTLSPLPVRLPHEYLLSRTLGEDKDAASIRHRIRGIHTTVQLDQCFTQTPSLFNLPVQSPGAVQNHRTTKRRLN